MTPQLDPIEIVTEEVAEAPREKRRYGNTLGLTKETNPKLSNRLPREKGAIVALAGDGLSPFERARKLLGNRFVDKRQFYLLDGRPQNTQAILDAGILKAHEVLHEHTKGTSAEIMGRALDFLWAQNILIPRVKQTSAGWLLDEKPTTALNVIAAARKLVDDLRKAARSTKRIEGGTTDVVDT